MVDISKWQNLNLAQQMGNIGSEFLRAKYWDEKNNTENAKKAFIRMIELLDSTIADKRFINRLKEILRLKEMLNAWYLKKESFYPTLSVDLDEYFTQFALYARRSTK